MHAVRHVLYAYTTRRHTSRHTPANAPGCSGATQHILAPVTPNVGRKASWEAGRGVHLPQWHVIRHPVILQWQYEHSLEVELLCRIEAEQDTGAVTAYRVQ